MTRGLGPAVGLTVGGASAIGVGVTAGRWSATAEPATELAETALRAALVGVGGYALLIGVLTLAAIVLGWSRARIWALRLGGARWGLAVGLGAAMVASSPAVAAASTAAQPGPTVEPATSVDSDQIARDPTAALVPLAPDSAPASEDLPEASLVPLPPLDPSPDDDDGGVGVGNEADGVGVGVGVGVGNEAEDAPGEWTVEQGDHLWAIAEQVVFDRQPNADDDAVASYWRDLVDANRDRLIVADNPDLIVPGQRLVLPPSS